MNTNNTNTNSQAHLIDEALTGLTEKQRQYVRLICISKSTLEQAAKMVGFSDNPARVYRRLTRIAAVREAMEKVNGIIAQSQNKHQHGGSSNEQKEQKQEAIREDAKIINSGGTHGEGEKQDHYVPAPAGKGTDALRSALREIIGDTLDEKRVTEIVREVVRHEVGLQPTRIAVVTPAGKSYEMGMQHKNFARLMLMLQAGRHVYLGGGAGTGKTTAGREAAKAMSQIWERELKFYFNGAIDSEHKLLGFVDAQGRIVSRPFREAFTKGGFYMFDEVDASFPSALLAFNAALSNDYCDFPDGCFQKHPDFRCMAAANTWGFGATHDYVGRMKIDEAFRNRFAMLNWEVDETLERHLALREIDDQDMGGRWVTHVQQCRAKAKIAGIRCVISPRASIGGCALLQAGDEWHLAEDAVIRMGMAEESWNQIKA